MEISLARQKSDGVELFRRQYLQLLELNLLTIPDPKILIRPDVQRQLYEKMFKSENVMFAPNRRYQLRVLKELVTRIENAISDPEEDVGFLYLLGRCDLLFSGNKLLCDQRGNAMSSHKLISYFLISRKYPMISGTALLSLWLFLQCLLLPLRCRSLTLLIQHLHTLMKRLPHIL